MFHWSINIYFEVQPIYFHLASIFMFFIYFILHNFFQNGFSIILRHFFFPYIYDFFQIFQFFSSIGSFYSIPLIHCFYMNSKLYPSFSLISPFICRPLIHTFKSIYPFKMISSLVLDLISFIFLLFPYIFFPICKPLSNTLFNLLYWTLTSFSPFFFFSFIWSFLLLPLIDKKKLQWNNRPT